MSMKSALIISGSVLGAAQGIYWLIPSREPSPEELYRQYMELSPFQQFDQKDVLLKKAAEAGYAPAVLQMAEDNFTDKKDLKEQEHDFWIKKAADQGDPKGQWEAYMSLDLPDDESLGYLMKAAGQSHGPALLELGGLYASGDEDYQIVRDEGKALKLYRQAAEANFPDALYLLYLLDKLNIFPLTEEEKKTDIYRRYLKAARKENEVLYPAFTDIQELTPDQCESISNFLRASMPNHEKVEPSLKKIEEEMFRKIKKGHPKSV